MEQGDGLHSNIVNVGTIELHLSRHMPRADDEVQIIALIRGIRSSLDGRSIRMDYIDGSPHPSVDLPHLGDGNDSVEVVAPDVGVEVEYPLPEESSRRLQEEDERENEFRWWDEFDDTDPDSDDSDSYDSDGSDRNIDICEYGPLSDAAVGSVLPKEEEPLPSPSRKRPREADTAEEQRPYKKSRRCRGFDDSSINTDNGGNGPLSDAAVDAVFPEEEEPPPDPSRKRPREADTAEEQRPYKKSRRCRGFDYSSINTDNGGNGPLSDAAVDAVFPDPSRKRPREDDTAIDETRYKKSRRCWEFDELSINTDHGGTGPLRNAAVDAAFPKEQPSPGPSRKRSRYSNRRDTLPKAEMVSGV